ncbi:hypothetical protein VZT92_012290 [Zoarces viviparus]|uniref:Uncharacterized protein n=1 Tax=Zoarces viviparus TaxID=48416 RepID=A0AAW1F7U5_ZOAVI
MTKPFANPLTFQLQICARWMFTHQSNPRDTTQSSMKTRTPPVNNPRHSGGTSSSHCPAQSRRSPSVSLALEFVWPSHRTMKRSSGC